MAARRDDTVTLDDVVGDIRPELLVRRAVRAARLESALYEEVEADGRATGQAAIVVLVSAFAAGLWLLQSFSATTPADLLTYVFADLLAWGGYAYMAWLIGTTFLRGRETDADPGQLARTLGFASAPRLLLFLPLPGLAPIIALWHLVASVIAVRCALDIGTGRAILVAIVSSFTLVVIEAMLSVILGPLF